MQREYMNYVNVACKEGLKPEEVQSLFNNISKKADTKQGKRVLRLFAKGIGNVKKKSLMKQQQIAQQQINQQQVQPEITYENSRQFIYTKN